MSALDSLVLRDLTALSDLRLVEQLQKEVWGVADLEVFPALALTPVVEVGGVLIGAFDEQRMVGFVFGFPGHEEGKLILHSDMLAVRPEYRRFGLGYQLKLAQRERALAKGIQTITWTFDPLQARNARLNFGKLGVISNSYRPDYYGETTSFLHQTGTDRLWVTWHLNSERVRTRIAGSSETIKSNDNPIILSVGVNEEPVAHDVALNDGPAFIEIPIDINDIISRDVGLARRWRLAAREAFLKLMRAEFMVTEFSVTEGEFGKVGRYELIRPLLFSA